MSDVLLHSGVARDTSISWSQVGRCTLVPLLTSVVSCCLMYCADRGYLNECLIVEQRYSHSCVVCNVSLQPKLVTESRSNLCSTLWLVEPLMRCMHSYVADKNVFTERPLFNTWWLGVRVVKTSDSRLAVEGSPPGHDTAWLFISETDDRLWRVNCLENCNHHLGQLSLASLHYR